MEAFSRDEYAIFLQKDQDRIEIILTPKRSVADKVGIAFSLDVLCTVAPPQ